MNKIVLFKKTIVASVVFSMLLPYAAFAAPLDLAQFPAGTASRKPQPLVVISVDNSGSMGIAFGNDSIGDLRTALRSVFSSANIPDNKIRLAYQALHGCNSIPSNNNSCRSGGVSWNTMRPLVGTENPSELSHRGQFFRWIDTLVADGGTPTHSMMRNAGEYLKTTGINSPWNTTIGVADTNPFTCRRAYHVLMTDGGWNSVSNTFVNSPISNADGITKTLPDSIVYDPASNQSNFYRDYHTYSPSIPTISDMAFHYWSEDLQPGITNGITPLMKKEGTETFIDGLSSVDINEYWNPKNNPATWQHMTTYTIGYNNAANWPDRGGTNPLFNTVSGMYGGDFVRLGAGTRSWANPFTGDEDNRAEEMWHAAINSRGKFYPAGTAAELQEAFVDIFATITKDSTAPVTSVAANSSTSVRSDVAIYRAGYEANGWKGYVESNIVTSSGAIGGPNLSWGTTNTPTYRGLNTADKLDALTASQIQDRVVITTNDATNTGVPFKWSANNDNLSADQKLLLNAGNLGEDRLNFIRGDRSKEGDTAGAPFRIRTSRHGDIVNSVAWYTSTPVSNYSYPGYSAFVSTKKDRLPMIYVGANDGMLHGFSAVDGTERLAFIPKGVIKNLPELSKPNYQHLYYVDGSPFTGDVDVGAAGTPNWKTLLIGSLGAGGKGYFVLDVTDPGTKNVAANPFASAAPSSVVVMDKTFHKAEAFIAASENADIGNIFAAPTTDESNPFKASQITKLNNNRWAVVMGNGYNSTNERPVLLVQYLDGAKELKRIVAATAPSSNAVSNGLSEPRLVDINADGRADVVYAGDLKGNMWKFDITSNLDSQWGVAFSGQPLFTATYSSGGTSSVQPITAAPTTRTNDRNSVGMMVAFGTGRNLTEADRTDTSVQSIYSVLDPTKYAVDGDRVKVVPSTDVVVSNKTDLVKQSISATSMAGSGVAAGQLFWTATQNNVEFEGANAKKGWYLDLPIQGERNLQAMAFFQKTNILEIMTQVPASGGNSTVETCDPVTQEVRLYRTFMNIVDGKRASWQIIDLNGDGFYNTSDNNASRMEARKGAQHSVVIVKNNKKVVSTTGSGSSASNNFNTSPQTPLRPSWRQMQ